MRLPRFLFWLLPLTLATPAFAALVPAPLFASGAVLPRDRPFPVWGRAPAGDSIEVSFAGQARSTQADPAGRWQVMLDPLPASTQGRPLNITASSGLSLRFEDILVGDLWLLSGQSNIAWPLARSSLPDDMPVVAPLPHLRQLTVNRVASDSPRLHVQAAWSKASASSAETFSGIGYFFGHQLLTAQPHVPVGLILAAWGGTPLEAWTPRPALESSAEGRRTLASWSDYWTRYQDALAHHRAHPASPAPSRDRFQPSALYNAMIHPFTPGSFHGVIWYQGESNALRPEVYAPPADYSALLRTHLLAWREAFNDPDLPFLLVQLPNYVDASDPTQSRWAEIRHAQTSVLDLPFTDLVPTFDVGDPTDLHPTNKHPVGRRLATLALHPPSASPQTFSSRAPLPFSATRENAIVTLHFHPHSPLSLQPVPDHAPAPFELAGSDQVFHPAHARLLPLGLPLQLVSPAVPLPTLARYAWHNNPSPALFTSTGLPALPFSLPVTPAPAHP